jgi:HSP20 family protein
MKLYNHNLLQDKALLNELARQIEMMNTVNGGTTVTTVDVIGQMDCIVIKVMAPTIPVESFNVLLSYTKLTVSIFAKDESSNAYDRPVVVPMFMRTFDIPAFVDLDRIEAVHENNELQVILPLKTTTDSLQRMIDIREL